MKLGTQQVQLYEIPQTNIYLADSPGFGDTYLSGASILAELDEALAELFHDQDVKLAGVLFLHSMTDAKIKGPARINLILLRKLVGSMNLDKCHLVLTKKSLAHRSPEDALEELCEEGGFWEPLVDDGATPALFADSRDSALKIIEPLLKDSNVVLKLTRETQIEERDLKDTKAGRLVSKEICQKRKDMQRDMKHMRDEEQRAMRRNDQESARLYYEAQVEASSNIANLNREGAKLRTRAEASSWLKLRWSGRVCAGVAAGCAIIASNGTLTPLVTSLHSAAEKKIQTWR
ncbi:Nn.00g033970.m01.CDS01 [Neocucurbitaria sp. VM-36]